MRQSPNWAPILTERHLARERLIRLTEYTIIDRVKVRALIEEARRNGFAISDQEMDVDGCGVAAPIFDGEGAVVTALDIAVAAHRFASRKQELLEAVIEHAHMISARNGYRGTLPNLAPSEKSATNSDADLVVLCHHSR